MAKAGELPNDKLVVLAAFVAGAAKGLVDTEDIAVRANELAPGKFSWRKYPEQINIEAVRKRLYDAAKVSKGSLVTGSEKGGWLLTETGVAFASQHTDLLSRGLDFNPRLSARERTWQTHERARMMKEPAYAKWLAGNQSTISQQEAERFFAVDDYLKGIARQSRLQRVRDIFRGDRDLNGAILEIEKMLGGEA